MLNVRSKKLSFAFIVMSALTIHNTLLSISWGYAQMQGRSEYMEDRIDVRDDITDHQYFFGIFDGHRGSSVAELLQRKLYPTINEFIEYPLLSSIKKTEHVSEAINIAFNVMDGNACYDQGACALMALCCDNKMYVAHAGDSRAVLYTNNTIKQLTIDHKPNDPIERARIRKCGGTTFVEPETIVINPDGSLDYTHAVWRIPGGLAVSRSIGDHDIKKNWQSGLIATPDIFSWDICPEDQFMILASDGIWDVVSSNQAIEFVLYTLQLTNDLNQIAQKLCLLAYDFGSGDNLSVIIVRFDQ